MKLYNTDKELSETIKATFLKKTKKLRDLLVNYQVLLQEYRKAFYYFFVAVILQLCVGFCYGTEITTFILDHISWTNTNLPPMKAKDLPDTFGDVYKYIIPTIRECILKYVFGFKGGYSEFAGKIAALSHELTDNPTLSAQISFKALEIQRAEREQRNYLMQNFQVLGPLHVLGIYLNSIFSVTLLFATFNLSFLAYSACASGLYREELKNLSYVIILIFVLFAIAVDVAVALYPIFFENIKVFSEGLMSRRWVGEPASFTKDDGSIVLNFGLLELFNLGIVLVKMVVGSMFFITLFIGVVYTYSDNLKALVKIRIITYCFTSFGLLLLLPPDPLLHVVGFFFYMCLIEVLIVSLIFLKNIANGQRR